MPPGRIGVSLETVAWYSRTFVRAAIDTVDRQILDLPVFAIATVMMHCLSEEAVSYVDCMEALPSGYQSAVFEQLDAASAAASVRTRVKSSVNVRRGCRGLRRVFILNLQR